MVTSVLEQFRVSDFVEWHAQKKLVLNPHFQRGSVWTTPAKVFLIDTILRDLPMPKLYLRTQINAKLKTSYREVVDGQQRLKAILDFASDNLRLSKRAGEFEGLRYSTLSEDLQTKFLSYPIAVDQLINAADDDVLEVFARLNSYTVTLNDPEKRHARFQGGFKWAVRSTAQRWGHLFDRLGTFTIRDRVRMLDDSLVAEMFIVAIDGVTDGGQAKITKFYERMDPKFLEDDPSVGIVNEALSFIEVSLTDAIAGTQLANAPHLLMLFAAVCHALQGLPLGQLEALPERTGKELQDMSAVKQNLLVLADVIGADTPIPGLEEFWRAALGTTQRIASRSARFPTTFRALQPEPVASN
jgi:hypothetical protein